MAKLQHAVDQTCEHGKPEVGPKRACGNHKDEILDVGWRT
jgi:hypothetical protein